MATTSDLRDRIVTAAFDLLRERGAKGLSQPQVARRAGIPQGHLTYYFPKRADLLAAVGARVTEHMEAELATLGARLLTDRTGGRGAAASLIALLVLDVARTRALLGLVVEGEEDEALRRSLAADMDRGRPALAALLEVEPDDPVLDVVSAACWGLEVQQLVQRRGRAQVVRVVERLIEWIDVERGARAAASERPRRTTKTRKHRGGVS